MSCSACCRSPTCRSAFGAGSRMVRTRGSCTLAATITALSPIESAAPRRAAVSPELAPSMAAMLLRERATRSGSCDVAAEHQRIADHPHRFEAAPGAAQDDRAEAEHAPQDRLIDI